MALLNDVAIETKVIAVKKKKSLASVAREIGTAPQFLNRVVNGKVTIVNDTYIRALEALGYDIRLEFVPRENRDFNDKI